MPGERGGEAEVVAVQHAGAAGNDFGECGGGPDGVEGTSERQRGAGEERVGEGASGDAEIAAPGRDALAAEPFGGGSRPEGARDDAIEAGADGESAAHDDDEPEHLPLGDAGLDHASRGDDSDDDRRDDVRDAGAREIRHERAVAVSGEPVGEGQQHVSAVGRWIGDAVWVSPQTTNDRKWKVESRARQTSNNTQDANSRRSTAGLRAAAESAVSRAGGS